MSRFDTSNERKGNCEMTTVELYEKMHGDYNDAISRLSTDALVGRFIAKYPGDPSYSEFIAAWEAGDEVTAFRAAHTLKGVCANLSISGLFKIASAITEALRPGNEALKAETNMEELVEQLKAENKLVVDMIAEYTA